MSNNLNSILIKLGDSEFIKYIFRKFLHLQKTPTPNVIDCCIDKAFGNVILFKLLQPPKYWPCRYIILSGMEIDFSDKYW